MDIAKLGSRVRSRRERLGLRQSDIAAALQISSQAVSKWERGENAPDIAVLIPLSRLLGVSVEWLLGGTIPDTDTFPATVFCSDLSGYAAKATVVSPRDVAAWINGIHYIVTEAVKRFDGIPVKYVGDGSLSFFTGAGSAERALKAACRARKTVGGSELHVALHFGDVFLGMIGHPDYESSDIIGQTVNTAFLVLPWIAGNCNTGIGVTGEVADAMVDGSSLDKRGEVTVLGVDSPVEIYEPINT